MSYSDLLIKPGTTLASTCGSFSIVDLTGIWDPDNPTVTPGGYAPGPDESTATRPTEAQTQRWYLFDTWQPNGNTTPTIPATQPDATSSPYLATAGTLDEDEGLPLADRIRRVFLIVAPVAEVYATWYAIYQNDFLGFIDYAQANWAVGVVSEWSNCQSSACLYEEQKRLNNLFPANCSQEGVIIKQALMQGDADNLTLGVGAARADAAISTGGVSFWDSANNILQTLLRTCADPQCDCNC